MKKVIFVCDWCGSEKSAEKGVGPPVEGRGGAKQPQGWAHLRLFVMPELLCEKCIKKIRDAARKIKKTS